MIVNLFTRTKIDSRQEVNQQIYIDGTKWKPQYIKMMHRNISNICQQAKDNFSVTPWVFFVGEPLNKKHRYKFYAPDYDHIYLICLPKDNSPPRIAHSHDGIRDK